MFKYDFDEVINRKNTGCAKYDEVVKKFGTEDVIPLWIADMDFKTAKPIIDALVSRAEEGIYGYVSRSKNYFESGCKWKSRRNNWEINPELCSHAVGVVPAMTVMAEIFLPEDSRILIQPPVYSEFYEIVEKSKNIVVANHLVEKEGRWSVDWEDFENKIKTVSMFLFCNPHNPLGIVWAKEDVERVVRLCVDNNVLLISDEIHSDLVFGGKQFIPTASVNDLAKNNVISCFSASKTFNMAGLQACTVVFPNKELKDKYDKWWSDKDIHRNNSFSSIAMEVCYEKGEDWLEQLLIYIEGNIDYVNNYLRDNILQIKTYKPDATYLMWLDCRGLGLNNDDLKNFMIQEAKLGLNEGRAFDRELEGYMRLNVACPRSVLERAMFQLKIAVDKLMGIND
ncbi:MAG: MalY/PatB family protein [Filifactoraceae bacterium]